MNKPIYILGAGGHAKVLLDILLLKQENVAGLFDVDPILVGKKIFDVPILAENILLTLSPQEILLVNGIGSITTPTPRQNIFEQYKAKGYTFLTVIHPQSYIGREVEILEGAQIMAGSIIQPGCKIGKNSIINTHASIDHDCIIRDHVHIAPGVTCCGGVEITSGCHIGTGAVLLQGIQIGAHSLVAAGSVVTQSMLKNSKAMGVPAKVEIRENL